MENFFSFFLVVLIYFASVFNTFNCLLASSNEFVNKRNGDLIRLNVGGQEFVSERETLRKTQSRLKEIVDSLDLAEKNARLAIISDENESEIRKIFIDRSPKHFSFLLDFLRCDNYGHGLEKLYEYLRANEMMREAILDEALYYGLNDVEKLAMDYYNNLTMTLDYQCDDKERRHCKPDTGLICINSTCQCASNYIWIQTHCVNRCPEEWHNYMNQKCFHLFRNESNYWQARETCKSNGNSTLLELKSADKFQFFVDYLTGINCEYHVLIDLKEGEEDDRVFRWQSDGTRVNETFWAPGEPNSFNGNKHGEECAHLRRDNGFRINDTPCFFKTYFICEKDMF